MNDPIQTALAYWERRAEQHPVEAERHISEEIAWRLVRFKDAEQKLASRLATRTTVERGHGPSPSVSASA
jgi:hypothetical protein